MTRRLKVGVVGAGVIAQVMHLHYLRELSDRFEIAAICDVSGENADKNAQRYHVVKTFSDWREMVNDNEMNAAAEAAGVTLMVAYPKRYDPAFERFRTVALHVAEPRLMRVTTFESPFLPYIGHYSLAPVSPIPPEAITNFRAEKEASITRAIGEANQFLRDEYHLVLLDTLVHEINTIRGVLGEPTSLEYVDMQPVQLTVILKFGEVSVSIHWMDLPGITRYG